MTPKNPAKSAIRIGTRGSALAKWQAEWVSARLQELGAAVELVFIKTGGDGTTTPIAASGEQGLFTKEIQRALLDRRVDLAVHSLKDLPTDVVDGLTLAAVPTRETTQDAFVSNKYSKLDELPQRARVGTGSRRRQSQLLYARPDLEVRDIRGNVDTRLKKLDDGEYDAIILATAGLKRLGLADRIKQQLPVNVMLPAIGQGALGLETRSDDEATIRIVAQLDDIDSHCGVLAERTMLSTLRGGCLAPVGAHSRIDSGSLWLDGVVLSPDGKQRIIASRNATPADAASLGTAVANDLLEQGARDLIEQARSR
ncbi:MAG: hydroxymethylbilane synthase [Planctomycetaceae bacterium]|nr:hydroxymethylbilane synthase [Planctomycetaceae bacterium]